MNTPKQLLAVLRKLEIEEQKCLQYKLGVEKVLVERENVYQLLLEKHHSLKERIKGLNANSRKRALQRKNIEDLQGVLALEKKLNKEIDKLKQDLLNKQNEVNSALERASLANKEWIAAKMEKQKVEKLLEKKASEIRVFEVAKDENLTDELSSKRSK